MLLLYRMCGVFGSSKRSKNEADKKQESISSFFTSSQVRKSESTMLHDMNIRKRPHTHHENSSSSLEIRDGDAKNAGIKSSKDKKKSKSAADVRIAYLAIGSFILVGFIAGYLILHNQHRKSILHVWQNGWGAYGEYESEDLGILREEAMKKVHHGPPKVVTVVLPSVVNPKGRQKRLQSIHDTWGAASRALYVVHNTSEFPELSDKVISNATHPGTVHHQLHSYPRLLLVPPGISIDQGVPRLLNVIETIHKVVNPEFAFFVNDHTFVIPEHLCKFLSTRDHTKPMYAGHALKENQNAFNSGAAGYILSRHTMKGLVDKWREDDSTCLAKGNKDMKWLQGNPGLVTATCLREALHTKAEDTRDGKGKHRFHAFGLVRSYTGQVDQWYQNKHKDMDKILETDETYTMIKGGLDCCSEESISFHYVEYLETRALYLIRQRLLKEPGMSDKDLMNLVKKEWPEKGKLGGYSHPLPNAKLSMERGILPLLRSITSKKSQDYCFPVGSSKI